MQHLTSVAERGRRGRRRGRRRRRRFSRAGGSAATALRSLHLPTAFRRSRELQEGAQSGRRLEFGFCTWRATLDLSLSPQRLAIAFIVQHKPTWIWVSNASHRRHTPANERLGPRPALAEQPTAAPWRPAGAASRPGASRRSSQHPPAPIFWSGTRPPSGPCCPKCVLPARPLRVTRCLKRAGARLAQRRRRRCSAAAAGAHPCRPRCTDAQDRAAGVPGPVA